MSLILKGIDIPSEKEGWQIDLRIHGFDDGTMMVEKLTRNGRPPFKMYRAIQIPKGHGRLIDGDELRATLRRWTEDEWNQKASPVSWAYAYEDLIDLIDDAPTILEVEEDE